MISPNFLRLPKVKRNSTLAVGVGILVALGFFIWQISIHDTAKAATITWDGGGANNSWHNALNWSTDTVPTSSDIAVFDGTSSKNATISSNVTVNAISITAGYGGTISQNSTVRTTGASGFSMAGGTWTGSTSRLTLTGGDFSLSGGTFTAPDVIRIEGGDWDVSGGTFSHNNGLVGLESNGSDCTHIVSGTNTFYDLKTFDAGGCIGDIQFEAGSTQTILGEALFSMQASSSIDETTRMNISSSSGGSAATLDIDGSLHIFSAEVQDITIVGSEYDCGIRCVDLGGNTNIDFSDSIDVWVSPIHGETTEAGGTAWFDVVLTSEPSADVTIGVSSSDTGEGTPSTGTLTFTNANWEDKQTVTVTGVDDAEDDGTQSYTIQLAATASADTAFSGIDPDDVTVNNQDDDVTSNGFTFDYLPHFDNEDVAPVASVANYREEAPYDGLGDFYNSSPAKVDVRSTKIKAGCKVSVETYDEYTISQVVNPVDHYNNVTVTRENDLSENINDEMSIGSYETVNYIHCIDAEDGFMKLGEGLVQIEEFALQDVDDMGYATTEDKVFAPLDGSGLVLIDVATSTKSTTSFGATDDLTGAAYDSVRGNIWVANYDDDQVIAVDASDGSFAFGTEGASTFSAPNAWSAVYDDTNDKIWVGNFISGATQIDPSDGSTLNTVSTVEQIYDMAYDSTNDSIWLLTDYYELVEIDGATATFKNGTFENSVTNLPRSGSTHTRLTYDSTNDVLWILDDLNANAGFVTRVRASDGVVTGMFPVNAGQLDVNVSPDGSEVWVTNEYPYTVSVLDATTGELKATYGAGFDNERATFTSNGDFWMQDNWAEYLIHYDPDGHPVDNYYTVTSTATNDIDVSGESGIATTTVTETLNGQNIYYTVSFDDGLTWEVFGSDRPIASDRDAITGLGDGTWAYRDNADTWTAADVDDKNAAISQAVAAGANNQMSGTDLEALSSADWETMGFDPGTTNNLNLAATFYTDDAHDSPELESVTFTFGAAAGSSGGDSDVIEPEDVDVAIDLGAECSADTTVSVTLTADNATHYIISDDAELTGAEWKSIAFDENNQATIEWTLPEGDGEKTVYAKFRSSTQNVSELVSDSIQLDEEGQCAEMDTIDDMEDETELFSGCMNIPQEPVGDEEMAAYRFGISPETGAYSTADMVRPGDAIRGKSFNTVYCIAEDYSRRPFIDEVTYFTHFRSFDTVRWVEDDALAEFPLKSAVLPNLGKSLLKFSDSPEVYWFSLSDDLTRGTLSWITTEELASVIVGADWDAYVIDLNPLLRVKFDYGEPIVDFTEVDTSMLRKREYLNEASAGLGRESLETQLVRLKDSFLSSLLELEGSKE